MNLLTNPIQLLQPGTVEFGPGTIDKLGPWAKAKGYQRIFVISGAFNANRVSKLHLGGEIGLFGSVKPEPDADNLADAVAAAARFSPELIIGFGGGSAMDIAKLVAVLCNGHQSLSDIVGPDKVTGRRIGLAQIPTTAGTGSEVGTRALVTDPATQNKWAVQSQFLLADIAIIDPDLTMSIPASITAETGVDALAHCVEAYTSVKAHPIMDVFALEGIRLIGKYLAAAVQNGNDGEARAGLALASMYGGICLGPVNTAGGHAVAYPLGTRHHISHGAANAVIFPHVLAYNAPYAEHKTAAVLRALGLDSSPKSENVSRQAYRYCEALGIEMRLLNRNVPESDLENMAREAFAIKRLIDNNPRPLSHDAILQIYRAAY
ncbi:MAG: iron-containing alcohol dehydrogenase [Hyphomicrobiales bacterium]|nr:iron-containing alcohol dehydrogenase [Hyphomicrobiales bacterium]